MSIKITKMTKACNGLFDPELSTTAIQVTVIGAGGGGASGSALCKDFIFGSGFPGSSGKSVSKLVFIEDFDLVDGKISFVVGSKGKGGKAVTRGNGIDGDNGSASSFGNIFAQGGLYGSSVEPKQLNQLLLANNTNLSGSAGKAGDGGKSSIKENEESCSGMDGNDGAIFIIEYLSA